MRVSFVGAGCQGRHQTSSSDLHGVLALQVNGPARDWVAIDEEENEQEAVHRHQQLCLLLGSESILGQRHGIIDPNDRNEWCRHGENGVPVHPGRNHPLYALRQNDAPKRLHACEGETFGAFPLAGGDRVHCPTNDFRHVRHDR